jgi:hypothetical protein
MHDLNELNDDYELDNLLFNLKNMLLIKMKTRIHLQIEIYDANEEIHCNTDNPNYWQANNICG